MNKATIRSKLIQQRKQLSHTSIANSSEQIQTNIKSSRLYKTANHIAVYLPINGEVDLTQLLQDSEKQFYVPTIDKHRMQFQLYHHDLIMEQHQFGVTQPKFIADYEKPHLDLCLMPLVGFDQSGNRLGMGGGYYDRYFEHNSTTILAGVAYHSQKVEQLPADSWDVKLQHIFTEQEHITP